jgi:hypothetical protein
MKHLTMTSLMAATVALLAAGSASAQTLKADIPFTFHAAGATMAPGAYTVRSAQSSGSGYVLLTNTDTRKSVLAIYSLTDPSKEWAANGSPMLQFECSGNYCALSQAWTGAANPAFLFRGPKPIHEGDIRVAEVRMTTRAD